jgi:hypothetical protein
VRGVVLVRPRRPKMDVRRSALASVEAEAVVDEAVAAAEEAVDRVDETEAAARCRPAGGGGAARGAANDIEALAAWRADGAAGGLPVPARSWDARFSRTGWAAAGGAGEGAGRAVESENMGGPVRSIDARF